MRDAKKHQDVPLNPVAFCSMQASMLFRMFLPTILCAAEDTLYKLTVCHGNLNKADIAQTFERSTAESTFKCKYYVLCIPRILACAVMDIGARRSEFKVHCINICLNCTHTARNSI